MTTFVMVKVFWFVGELELTDGTLLTTRSFCPRPFLTLSLPQEGARVVGHPPQPPAHFPSPTSQPPPSQPQVPIHPPRVLRPLASFSVVDELSGT